jgi:Txe/YoeB family toxin of Txe-Axe toxin-antitoxin module
METVFQTTKSFEKDLNKLSAADKGLVIQHVNKIADLFRTNQKSFYSSTYRPMKIKLPPGLDSSLYSMRINQNLRVIFSIEDDPLFEQTNLTLFRIAKTPKALRKSFSSIVESLYQSQLQESNPREENDAAD